MIKVSYCVAYDWELLRFSLPSIYRSADVICLSVDKNRQSWSGYPISWDEAGFRQMVAEIDSDRKITLFEDSFYDSSLQPMQNEVAQRNRIAQFLGLDGWHVQLDADEYFLNFDAFVHFLRNFKTERAVNICCPMINLYKQIPEGMLWIKPTAFEQIEYFPIATRFPKYEYGRRNGYFNVLTNFTILHQSWARSEKEIWEKLNNWGHAKDFDIAKYFLLWQEADADNYKNYKNFHHLYPNTWPALDLQPRIKSMLDAVLAQKEDFPLPIRKWDLQKSNSIWLSRIKKVWSTLAH